MATLAGEVRPQVRDRSSIDWPQRLAQVLLLVACTALIVFLLAPLAAILMKSVEDKSGAFVGLVQFREYVQSPALVQSATNTLFVAAIVTIITIPLAFTFAYALTRSCMPAKGAFRLIALTPILAPSRPCDRCPRAASSRD